MSESLQVWVRNDKGQVYGPLSPPSVELLLDHGVIAGRLQVSTDGEHYLFPGRVPGLRVIFPRETWGEVVVEGEALDAEWSAPVPLAALPGDAPLASPSGMHAVPAKGQAPGGPVAGPGAVRAPAPRVAPPRVGPSGVHAPSVPGPPVRSAPSAVVAPGPAFRSSPSVADIMNSDNPASPIAGSSPSGVRAAPFRSSPSVSDIMSSPDLMSPVVASSNSGIRAAAPPVSSAPRPPVATAPSAVSRPSSSPVSGPVLSSNPSGVQAAPAAPVTSPPPQAPPVSSPSVAASAASVPGSLELPAQGALESISALQLYARAAASEVSGLLTLQLADRQLQVHFKKGNPEFLDSSHAEDSLEAFLVGHKLVSTAQVEQARAQAGRFGGELVPALFGLGLLNPSAAFQHLGQRASQLLFRALTAEHGTFSFTKQDLAAAKSMPLGNKWALYLEALRRVPALDVRRRFIKALELPVMKAGGLVPVTDLKLNPQETRAYTYFDGVRSLAQLATALPAESDVVVRTAWMLSALELVSFAQITGPRTAASAAAPPPPRPAAAPAPAPVPTAVAPAAVAAPPRAPAPAAARPASQPTPAPASAPSKLTPAPVSSKTPMPTPAPVPEDAGQLQGLLEVMRTQNYFDVLGLKRDAEAPQVKIAYLKAARSYHPDTVAPGSPEALAKVKADIFALIGEANRTLSDPALKKEYIAELEAGGGGSKVDVEKILHGEELFQKGRICVQARKYPDALKYFEDAILSNAEEPEFYAWRGYTKFLIAPDKKAALGDVQRDLKHCVGKNPNVSAVHYFLGFVAKAMGDSKSALDHFKRCVALDPKHIDAARELRTMK